MRVRSIQIEKFTRLLSAQIFKHLESIEQRDERSGRQSHFVRLGKCVNQRLSMYAQRFLSLWCGSVGASCHLSFAGGKPPRIDIQELGRKQQIGPLHFLCLSA
ncbi:hypothetical protein WT12_14995 [Burkholderia territorii]|nr:hypothetical protein WT12_14995 [Burkholderia territorii]